MRALNQEDRIQRELRSAPNGLDTETLAKRIGHHNPKQLAGRMGRLFMYGKVGKVMTDRGMVWKSGD